MAPQYTACTKFQRSCGNDQYLVVAKLRETLAVSKQAAKKSDEERLKEVTKQYQTEISDSFAASENISNSEDIIGRGRTLKRISKPQLKTVQVCMNSSSIYRGLMKDVPVF